MPLPHSRTTSFLQPPSPSIKHLPEHLATTLIDLGLLQLTPPTFKMRIYHQDRGLSKSGQSGDGSISKTPEPTNSQALEDITAKAIKKISKDLDDDMNAWHRSQGMSVASDFDSSDPQENGRDPYDALHYKHEYPERPPQSTTQAKKVIKTNDLSALKRDLKTFKDNLADDVRDINLSGLNSQNADTLRQILAWDIKCFMSELQGLPLFFRGLMQELQSQQFSDHHPGQLQTLAGSGPSVPDDQRSDDREMPNLEPCESQHGYNEDEFRAAERRSRRSRDHLRDASITATAGLDGDNNTRGRNRRPRRGAQRERPIFPLDEATSRLVVPLLPGEFPDLDDVTVRLVPSHLPRSSEHSVSPLDESTSPLDESTSPLDESTSPLNESTAGLVAPHLQSSSDYVAYEPPSTSLRKRIDRVDLGRATRASSSLPHGLDWDRKLVAGFPIEPAWIPPIIRPVPRRAQNDDQAQTPVSSNDPPEW